MAQVTIHDAPPETPTQAVVRAAKELVYITDARGRTIGLRRLPFLEEFRIIEAVGPQLSANTTYMGMLNPLLHVAEIDGQPVEIPRSKLQIDALIQRVDRDGFVAVVEGIVTHFGADQKDLEEKIKNVEGALASATASGS